jgi:hypothetical protein
VRPDCYSRLALTSRRDQKFEGLAINFHVNEDGGVGHFGNVGPHVVVDVDEPTDEVLGDFPDGAVAPGTATRSPGSSSTPSAPVTRGEPDFGLLNPTVERVLKLLLPAGDLTLVNVNFPAGEPKGLRWTRQSVRHYDGRVAPAEDPLGRRVFWFTVAPVEETEEGTDRRAVDEGYVSMTPLRLDLTDESELTAARERYAVD